MPKDFDTHLKDFDEAIHRWEDNILSNIKGWKAYFGAAYSTRITQAISAIRRNCDEMEKVIDEYRDHIKEDD